MPNLTRARELCNQFIKEMSENRNGYDDAGVARHILTDLDKFGQVRSSTQHRLSRWCHTNGSVFKRGMPIAQKISMALYDRIIERNEEM